MKRLATATVLLTALAAGAQAGSLPKPIRMVERMKMYSPTHYVRGDQGGSGGSGGYDSSTAEARQQAPAPKPTEKQKPEKPAKAD
jgi:opacity protein-like surface antigen